MKRGFLVKDGKIGDRLEKQNAGEKKIHNPQNTKILKTSRISINDFSFASNSIIVAWESTARPIIAMFIEENGCPAVENYSFTQQCVDPANIILTKSKS